MARKSYPKCIKCRKWTVGGANYCHHCGQYLKGNPNQFDSTIPIAPGPTKPRQPGSNNHKVVLAEGGLITVLAVADMVALGQEYYMVTVGLSIPLMAYTIPKIASAIGGLAVDIKSVWVRPLVPETEKSNPKPIQVEHVDEYGRPRLLYDFPAEIELKHLVHIAKRLEAGKAYSRRSMVQSGKLSQPQFEAITGVLLNLRVAKRKYPDAKNSPIELRAGGLALFQTAKKPLVGGGGWGTGSQIGPLVVQKRAGEGY